MIYLNFIKILFMIQLIISFSLNSQMPCSSFMNPNLGNRDVM